jgi:hypothetical protein
MNKMRYDNKNILYYLPLGHIYNTGDELADGEEGLRLTAEGEKQQVGWRQPVHQEATGRAEAARCAKEKRVRDAQSFP